MSIPTLHLVMHGVAIKKHAAAAEIASVAKQYAIYYKKQVSAPGETAYLMDHSRQAMLFGPRGEPIALITQDKGADAVVADIERWAH